MIPYVNSVGIRNGDYITSTPYAVQNTGTIIQVFLDKPYPVYPKFKLKTKQFREIPFFETMSTKSIDEWIELNSTTLDDMYLEDWDMSVQFIKIDGTYFQEVLTQEQIELLLSKKFHIKEVFNMIPKKLGSKVKKHTLIFRPSNWMIYIEETKLPTGIVVNMKSIDEIDIINNNNKTNIKLSDFDHNIHAISQFKRDGLLKWDSINECILKVIGNTNANQKSIIKLKSTIDWFSPALLKSLLQKLIRTGCTSVLHNNRKFPSEHVLLVCLGLLIINVGSFVPTIQRFVSGLESATKRLAITIVEDSYIPDYNNILLLLNCALLAQTKAFWLPTNELIIKWMHIAVDALKSKYFFVYDAFNFDLNELNKIKIDFNSEQMKYLASYKLLVRIKSFDLD